jgi:hypothetical protein
LNPDLMKLKNVGLHLSEDRTCCRSQPHLDFHRLIPNVAYAAKREDPIRGKRIAPGGRSNPHQTSICASDEERSRVIDILAEHSHLNRVAYDHPGHCAASVGGAPCAGPRAHVEAAIVGIGDIELRRSRSRANESNGDDDLAIILDPDLDRHGLSSSRPCRQIGLCRRIRVAIGELILIILKIENRSFQLKVLSAINGPAGTAVSDLITEHSKAFLLPGDCGHGAKSRGVATTRTMYSATTVPPFRSCTVALPTRRHPHRLPAIGGGSVE